ncbi:MAG: hypothetical protein JEZ02_12200 [Desulfatibacillum sp.]|nr:hypothetical protein [Desulfatibacillum sp.]
MKKMLVVLAVAVTLGAAGCNTYKAQPLSFKAPTSYANSQEVAGAVIAAKAYADVVEAKESFGFDVRKAGLLPVLVVFDNQGGIPLRINGEQTFLEDGEGNIWPVLADKLAYERVTKYADTEEIFTAAGKNGLLGAAAGALIGAAIGVVTGDSIGKSIGKGAAVGGAAGATLGGASKFGSEEASDAIIDDLESKTLENKPIPGQGLAYGYIFFPGEAASAKILRLQLKEEGKEPKSHALRFAL